MNLLEYLDPEIAAGVYYREYGDVETAKRLLSVALVSRDPTTQKFAWNLKSFILAREGRIDDALAASERARSFGGDMFPADNSKAVALLAAKRLDEALAVQLGNVERYPQRTKHTLRPWPNLSSRRQECRGHRVLPTKH